MRMTQCYHEAAGPAATAGVPAKRQRRSPACGTLDRWMVQDPAPPAEEAALLIHDCMLESQSRPLNAHISFHAFM